MIDISSLKGLTQDSRAVEPGFLFAAFKGERSDGCDFIPAAVERGASVILAPQGTAPIDGVELVTDANPRKKFASLVAEFYPEQPETIVAVTGTQGTTSIVNFVEQIWKSLGYKAASIGTLQGGQNANMTTSDPVTLHKNLTKLKSDGITHLAIEASSHGLHQYRIDGARLKAAGFTNLSRDHLDYHADMDEYLTAKSRLFTEVMDRDGTAILNADSPQFVKLKSQITSKVWTYGRAGEELHILSITPTAQGQNCEFKILNKTYRINLNLVGEFQVSNALCALGLVLSQNNVDTEKAIQSLENLKGAKGRVELVEGHPTGAAIYVDYAHTPDALEHVLKALRPHTENHLICLFGCGGDRDTGKRTEMGKIASALSDQVIVTDDNPRSEDPSSIRAQILKGILAAAPNTKELAKEVSGRRDAIHQTIQKLKSGDVLVIAGKGHEQGQTFADRTDPFDDVTEAKSAIKNL